MWRRLWLVGLAGCFGGLSGTPGSAWATASATAAAIEATRALADADLHRALQGVWCNADEGTRHCWAHDEFHADGRFISCGQAAGDSRPFRGAGRYTVTGQRMCYQLDSATPNFWLPAGARYCTDIVAIGATEHRYRDIDTGAEFTLLRQALATAPCMLAP